MGRNEYLLAADFRGVYYPVLFVLTPCKLLVFRAVTATNQKVGSSNLSGRASLLSCFRSFPSFPATVYALSCREIVSTGIRITSLEILAE
jgi:hypothetical protein